MYIYNLQCQLLLERFLSIFGENCSYLQKGKKDQTSQIPIMANQKTFICFWLIIIFFSSHSPSPTVSSEEVGDEHPFTYKQGTKKGPENWSKLKPEWRLCNAGKSQSPIELYDQKAKKFHDLEKLQVSYKPALAALKNRGHDIYVGWKGDGGGMVVNGTYYKLLQCHWHTPSEHTLNGKRYKMELHMVHESYNGQIAVISILYKLGRPDPFLKQFLRHVKRVDKELELGIVRPIDIKSESKRYYRYVGSLSTPPCSEGVLWTIIKKVRTVSRKQIRALREAVHDGFEENARPTQKLNGREVYIVRPKA